MIDENAIKLYAEKVKKYLQFVLYVCSENAEIVENPVQKQIYKRRNTVKDTYGEIRLWDVGYKIGSFIKAAGTGSGKSTGTGAKKRPHTRRGHWHHYKVGEGRKKTILKWIAPTFVNANDVGAFPASVIEMK